MGRQVVAVSMGMGKERNERATENVCVCVPVARVCVDVVHAREGGEGVHLHRAVALAGILETLGSTKL